jgi:hypothetical protein
MVRMKHIYEHGDTEIAALASCHCIMRVVDTVTDQATCFIARSQVDWQRTEGASAVERIETAVLDDWHAVHAHGQL